MNEEKEYIYSYENIEDYKDLTQKKEYLGDLTKKSV